MNKRNIVTLLIGAIPEFRMTEYTNSNGKGDCIFPLTMEYVDTESKSLNVIMNLQTPKITVSHRVFLVWF